MAIKTQFLGGGSNLKLKVFVDTGSVVTITCGDIVRNGTSVNGVATFSVTAGTWQVKAVLNGQESTDEITILEEYDITLGYSKPISELTLNTKIKLDDIKCFLLAINPQDYPNLYVVMTEDVYGPSTWGSNNMSYSGPCKDLCDNLYNGLSADVKACVVLSQCFAGYIANNNGFFPAAATQLGLITGTYNGHAFGSFSRDILATGNMYWTSTVTMGERNVMYSVNTNGALATQNITGSIYTRPIACLSASTLVSSKADDDGYYVVQGLGG